MLSEAIFVIGLCGHFLRKRNVPSNYCAREEKNHLTQLALHNLFAFLVRTSRK
jgi:hypothetical protein